jgi:hypothetical protein
MNKGFENAQQLSNLWIDFATRMTTAGDMAPNPCTTPTDAARDARSNIFETMTRYTDEFLRSEQFLQLMKQSLDASLLFRQQMNDFLTQAHHEMKGVAQEDVDNVLRSVRRMEKRTLEQLLAISSRLDEVTRRLEELEAGPQGKIPGTGSPAGARS